MNLKNFFLIFTIFMILCCISTVNASDDVNATIVSADNNVDELVSEVESYDDSLSAQETVEQVADVNAAASPTQENNVLKIDDNAEKISDSDDGMNHIYVSPDGIGDGSSAENATSIANAITANIASNTVIHLADGNYSLTKAVTMQKKENITIIAENPRNSKITSTVALTFSGCKNVLIKGITFITSKKLIAAATVSGVTAENFTIDDCSFEIGDKAQQVLDLKVATSLNIKNCYFSAVNALQPILSLINLQNAVDINIYNSTFENITTGTYARGLIHFSPMGNFEGTLCIDSCKFFNYAGANTAVGVISLLPATTKAPYILIKNNIFQNNLTIPCIYTADPTNTNYIMDISFENNTMNAPYAIRLGKTTDLVDSINAVIVNNNESVINGTTEINAIVMDDMGNRINHVNLKFIINETEYTPTFDTATGMYVLSYTPENIGSVEIAIECDEIIYIDFEFSTLIIKYSPGLTLNFTNITYGDEFKIDTSLKEDASGENITFTIVDSNGNIIKTINSKITNALANASFVDLSAGNYTVIASYAGDDNYGASSISKPFTVNSSNPEIGFDIAPAITVGDEIIITVNVPENVSGQFDNIQIGWYNDTDSDSNISVKESIPVTENSFNVVFDSLSVRDGYYCIMYNFISNNTNYNSYSTASYFDNESARINLPKFRIIKINSKPEIDVDDIGLGDNASIGVNGLSENATGTITFYIDGNETGATLNIDEIYNVSNLKAGLHTVHIVYSGDANHSSNETTATFTVHTITVKEDVFELNSSIVEAVLPDGCEGTVKLIVDNNDPIEADILNGIATFDLSALTLGEHELAFIYNGKYNINANALITVNPIVSPLDELTTDENTVAITLPADATGNMTIVIDGNDPIVVPVVNGTASYLVNDLSAGNHEITVSYNGNYPDFTTGTQTVTVIKATPKIESVIPGEINAGTQTVIPLSFPEDASGIVLVDVDGKKYYAELENGTANIAVEGLSAGNQTLTYRYLGDDKFAPVTGNVSITVRAPTTLTASVVKVTYGTSKKLTVTLKDNNKNLIAGKTVTVKLNNVVYTATTNADGKAVITVPAKLAPKTYKAAITFEGDANYVNSTKNVNVVVSKAASKLTVKKATYKVNAKTKKYTVTLKSGKTVLKKATVTIRVNAKNYKAVTNSKGVATFKFTNLAKKGTFNAIIKFAGNKYYKATSAKTQIITK